MRLKSILIGLAAVGLLALTIPVASAKDWTYQKVALATPLASVNNGTSNSTAGAYFTVPQGCDWSLALPSTAAGAGTSNTTYTITFSPDGTNLVTGSTITLTVAQNGTTAVAAGTNWARYTGPCGYQYGKVTSVTTAQGNAVATPYIYIASYQ